MIDSHILQPLLKELLSYRVILTDNLCIWGEKSKGYKINSDLLKQGNKEVLITNQTLVRKILMWNFTVNDSPINPQELNQLDRGILNNVQKINVEVETAYNIIRNVKEDKEKTIEAKKANSNYFYDKKAIMNSYWDCVSMITNKQFIYHHDSGGRVYTNITNLPSILRKSLRVNGKPIILLDLSCSQPIFISSLEEKKRIKTPNKKEDKKEREEREEREKYINNQPNPPLRGGSLPFVENISRQGDSESDHQLFKRLVQDGSLYDFLMAEYNALPTTKKPLTRRKIKNKFMVEVAYGDNTKAYASKTEFSLMFQELFPTIWNYIWTSKVADFKQLAADMTKVEADLMINGVCLRLIQEHPDVWFTPIHDAIATTEEHVELVREIIMQEFAKINLKPTLKIDKCDAPDKKPATAIGVKQMNKVILNLGVKNPAHYEEVKVQRTHEDMKNGVYLSCDGCGYEEEFTIYKVYIDKPEKIYWWCADCFNAHEIMELTND